MSRLFPSGGQSIGVSASVCPVIIQGCFPLGLTGFHSSPKECSTYGTIALILHASKVTLKILQARLYQYVNQELQMYKLGLEEAEELEVKLPTFVGSWRNLQISITIFIFVIHWAERKI